MNVGDVLNGYRLTTPPTNAGGGMSRWSFAERDGREHFVKMFLAPRYPLPETPGSEASKERRRAQCQAFEQRHRELERRLRPEVEGAANLVVPHDFFRVGTTYVKVSHRVQTSPLPSLAALSGHQVLVLVRSLVLGLRVLHRHDVVHGDLKADNILIEQRGDLYLAKLIDVDEAYIAGDPNPPDLIVGDPAFYSPEMLAYVKAVPGAGAETLQLASDMFSLGLLLHVVLAGTPVAFDRRRFTYPAEVVAAGTELALGPLPPAVAPTVAALLHRDPVARPTIHEVSDLLLALDPADLERPAPEAGPAAPPGPPTSPPSPELRSTMGRSASPALEESP